MQSLNANNPPSASPMPFRLVLSRVRCPCVRFFGHPDSSATLVTHLTLAVGWVLVSVPLFTNSVARLTSVAPDSIKLTLTQPQFLRLKPCPLIQILIETTPMTNYGIQSIRSLSYNVYLQPLRLLAYNFVSVWPP